MIKNEESRVLLRPNLADTPVNKTTLFMLPSLNLNKEKTSYRLLKYFGLVNCYIRHKQGPIQDPDTVCMVFNPTKDSMERFANFYEIYKTYPSFVTDYTVDQNLIVLVFKVQPRWQESYEKFKLSKYSKMSKEYAEMFKIPDLITGRVRVANEYHIIHKSKELRLQMEEDLGVKIDESWELASPLDLEKEEFDYEIRGRITEV